MLKEEKSLREGEEKMNLRERENVKTLSTCKTDIIYFYLYL